MTKKIGAIENGINLDHIVQGNAWYIIKLLRLNRQHAVGIGLNLPSRRMGVKDLLKIENFRMSQEQLHLVSVFAYGATYSEIENYQVVRKISLELPDIIKDLIICPNQRCISHQYKSCFKLNSTNDNIVARCHYCEQGFDLTSLTEYKL